MDQHLAQWNAVLDIKKRRVNEIIDKQRQHSAIRNQQSVDKVFRVLIEGESKKSKDDFAGRNDQNKVIVFPNFLLRCMMVI